MGLLGILVALGQLIWLAFRGWSVLLLAHTAGLFAAAAAREPLLAHWTQTFMGGAADAGGHRPWHIDLYHVALPGTPAIQNAIPMPFFGTTPFAARPDYR